MTNIKEGEKVPVIDIKEIDQTFIDRVLTLEAESAPPFPVYYGWDRKSLEQRLFGKYGSKAFGAFDGDKLVGWSAYEAEGDGVYQLGGMVVDKNYRRQGIGTRLLMQRLSELLKKPDLEKIYSTNYPKNTPIIMLLLQNGFEIEDFKKDLYGPGADRIITVYKKT